ncbi:unnamed protein product, partial [Prorocentrum cordatum]
PLVPSSAPLSLAPRPPARARVPPWPRGGTAMATPSPQPVGAVAEDGEVAGLVHQTHGRRRTPDKELGEPPPRAALGALLLAVLALAAGGAAWALLACPAGAARPALLQAHAAGWEGQAALAGRAPVPSGTAAAGQGSWAELAALPQPAATGTAAAGQQSSSAPAAPAPLASAAAAAGSGGPVASTSRAASAAASRDAALSARARDELVALIDAVQNDCSREAEAVQIGAGGGFASKFQLAAGKFAAALRRGRSARFVGHWAGYSEITSCKDLLGAQVFSEKGSYACFFMPETLCSANSSSNAAVRAAAEDAVAKLKEAEAGRLFNAVEAFMFRPRPATTAEFQRLESAVGLFGGDHEDAVLIGIHERRGDKISDTYNRYYTSMEYAQVAFAAAGAVASVRQADSAVPHRGERSCVVYVASDSSQALPDLQALLGGVVAGSCRLRVVGQRASVTQRTMDSHRFDHWGENQGMAGKVGRLTAAEARQATLEVLFDIYALSLADVLVGTLTSQIGRMAAGLRRLCPGGRALALDLSGARGHGKV